MRAHHAETNILHFLPNRGIGGGFFVRLQWPYSSNLGKQ